MPEPHQTLAHRAQMSPEPHQRGEMLARAMRGDDPDAGTCLQCVYSRVDSEWAFAVLRAHISHIYQVSRRNGRWRPEVPKDKRINPRTMRMHLRQTALMLDDMSDALMQPHTHDATSDISV